MKDAREVSTAPLVAVGLIGGFLTARETGIRPLGGVVLAAAGAYAARSWYVAVSARRRSRQCGRVLPRVRYRRGGLTDTPAADHGSIDRHTD